jgi:hypothetical protein
MVGGRFKLEWVGELLGNFALALLLSTAMEAVDLDFCLDSRLVLQMSI